MKATIIDEKLNTLRRPGELGHAGAELLVEALDPLLEQCPLLQLKAGHDSIVVPHDEHDILPEHSELLTLLVDLSGVVWHLKSQPLPVVHLTKQLEQGAAETHFNQASPRWMGQINRKVGYGEDSMDNSTLYSVTCTLQAKR